MNSFLSITQVVSIAATSCAPSIASPTTSDSQAAVLIGHSLQSFWHASHSVCFVISFIGIPFIDYITFPLTQGDRYRLLCGLRANRCIPNSNLGWLSRFLTNFAAKTGQHTAPLRLKSKAPHEASYCPVPKQHTKKHQSTHRNDFNKDNIRHDSGTNRSV